MRNMKNCVNFEFTLSTKTFFIAHILVLLSTALLPFSDIHQAFMHNSELKWRWVHLPQRFK